MRRLTLFCASQVLHEQDRKSACARAQSCRASIVPRTATREAAREVASKVALLRAKESLSTGRFLLHATAVSSGAWSTLRA